MRTRIIAALFAAFALLLSGCSHHFVMTGESIQQLNKSHRVGVVTDGKGGAHLVRNIEAGLMKEGVPVHLVAIEEFKDDIYPRKTYDLITDAGKLPRTLEITTEDYKNLVVLQAVNDYTGRTAISKDAMGFVKELRETWGIDFILVVHELGGFQYEAYMVDTMNTERVFSFYVNADKKGWYQNFPTSRSKPSIDEYVDMTPMELARRDVAHFIVTTLTTGR